MAKTRLSQEDINQLLMIQMSIDAIRKEVNAQLSALSAQVQALLPDPAPDNRKTDWDAEMRRAGLIS